MSNETSVVVGSWKNIATFLKVACTRVKPSQWFISKHLADLLYGRAFGGMPADHQYSRCTAESMFDIDTKMGTVDAS